MQFAERIVHFFSNLIKHRYYYIEPCPKCGSRRTGRYIRQPMVDADYLEEQSLKHGEIVRFADSEPHNNAFCVDCGYRWPYTARILYVSSDRICKEVEARGTWTAYKELAMLNRQQRRDGEKKPARKAFRWFFGS